MCISAHHPHTKWQLRSLSSTLHLTCGKLIVECEEWHKFKKQVSAVRIRKQAEKQNQGSHADTEISVDSHAKKGQCFKAISLVWKYLVPWITWNTRFHFDSWQKLSDRQDSRRPSLHPVTNHTPSNSALSARPNKNWTWDQHIWKHTWYFSYKTRL